MVKDFTLTEILDDYNQINSNKEEHEMVLWGSKQSMLNRFLLAAQVIKWELVKNWVDIGSGTGTFLQVIEQQQNITAYTGLDLSPRLVEHARDKIYKTQNVSYLCHNLMDRFSYSPFDLLTAIGMLQKCGVSLNRAFSRFNELMKIDGQLFITTKNLDWIEFTSQKLKPYEGHHWFRINDLKSELKASKFELLELGGILPQTGEIVVPENSHTIFIHAIKRANL